MESLIQQFGWPGGLFLSGCITLGIVGRVLFKMFFNREEDKNGRKIGYFDQWLEANIRMMGTMELGIEKMTDQGVNTHNVLVAFAQQHREDVAAIRTSIEQSQRIENQKERQALKVPPVSGIGSV